MDESGLVHVGITFGDDFIQVRDPDGQFFHDCSRVGCWNIKGLKYYFNFGELFSVFS